MRTSTLSTERLSTFVRSTFTQQLFFIQLKIHGLWTYLYPLTVTYGYRDVESCEDAIHELELVDDAWDLDCEYRIKEELV